MWAIVAYTNTLCCQTTINILRHTNIPSLLSAFHTIVHNSEGWHEKKKYVKVCIYKNLQIHTPTCCIQIFLILKIIFEIFDKNKIVAKTWTMLGHYKLVKDKSSYRENISSKYVLAWPIVKIISVPISLWKY